ncbi:MAG TPA: hypothetical protein VGO59_07140 [Verrucomicrobiae bacterium]|jgi:hypothetical protein
MPWNTLAAADVLAEILPDEAAMLNTIQGSAPVLSTILSTVTAEIQAGILVGGNQIGQPGTVPDQIRSDAIAMARWKWFCSLPKTDLQSDFRRAQHDEAVKRMEKIRAGREKVEIPAQPQNATGPSFRMEAIRRGHRLNSDSFDKMGET